MKILAHGGQMMTILVTLLNQRGHKLGKRREFEKLSKSQGKLREIKIFVGKTRKTQGKHKICDILANENVFERIFHLKLLREKFENTLEISGKTRGI